MTYENRGVFGLNLKHWSDREGSRARIVTPLRGLLQSGVIRPVVNSTFPFHRAADAHRRLMAGANIGKVLLIPTRLEALGGPVLTPRRPLSKAGCGWGSAEAHRRRQASDTRPSRGSCSA